MHMISHTNTNTMYSRQKYYWWPKMQNVTNNIAIAIFDLYLFLPFALPINIFALFFVSVSICCFMGTFLYWFQHSYNSFQLFQLK